MNNREFILTMEDIIQAMREKGYDPYQQLKGYLLENEPGYITRYKDARTLIQTLDKEQVEQYLAQYEKKGIKRNEKHHFSGNARLRKKHIGYSACKKDTLRLHRQ